MPEYGQFCPVAKASDIIGERWTVLILRELLLGTTRYNDFQRALSRISPTLLSKRLKMLEEKGLSYANGRQARRVTSITSRRAGESSSP